ncbi:unnamed protein product, partial [marine sediment metagenome]
SRVEYELPPLTLEEWIEEYRSSAQDFRAIVKARAQSRCDNLAKGAPKVKGLRLADEAKAFKMKGKRWKAVYEPTENGWKLRCPNCGIMTLMWERK